MTERIPLSKIRYGHSPDKRGERADKYGRQPIDVKRSGGGYVVHDGNDRLYYAKKRGDTHIAASVVAGSSGGCLIMTVWLVALFVAAVLSLLMWI